MNIKYCSCNNNTSCKPELSSVNGFTTKIIGHCQVCNQTVDLFVASKTYERSGLFTEEIKQGPRPFKVNMRMVL